MILKACPWCRSTDIDDGTASTEAFEEGFYAECRSCGFMCHGPTELSVQVPWNAASDALNTDD